ncbi:hypothetical protein BIFBRE_04254 [Bifidobacterium breve DSM 20213 = JCM 1192]|uniref:Uncharacterized protein n=1 Tax=Bifidobacterium breve DSM 20213 = JCM 1192 TaxID=518634 RepID=D4BQ86_BIFBR|nr:hypothetical protein BIFBRE_04254 [Bifidobacterium breve DSM 20213 = JCM 1192]
MLRVLIGYPLRRDFIVVALLGYHNKRNIRKNKLACFAGDMHYCVLGFVGCFLAFG